MGWAAKPESDPTAHKTVTPINPTEQVASNTNKCISEKPTQHAKAQDRCTQDPKGTADYLTDSTKGKHSPLQDSLLGTIPKCVIVQLTLKQAYSS
ncbi:hypothetical protein B4Q13_18660 [Lacticaseibacillus rhamnosus]